jgi:nitrous oxide reductase accessory protein NosL
MKKIHFLFMLLTCLWAGIFATSCESKSSENTKKDNHEGHNHAKDDHAGHNHDGHDHSKEKKNVELLAHDCKTCGMPSNEANWSVKHAPPQKEETFFCSPKCYFKATLTEKEYQSGEHVTFSVFGQKNKNIEAKKAYFVRGTSEKNPMGVSDLLVSDTEENAKKLKDEKKGKEVLTFEKITPEIIKN